MIAGTKRFTRWASCALALLAAWLATSAAQAQSPAAPTNAASAEPPARNLRLSVLNSRTSQPIPGVRVRVAMETNLVTGDAGACSLILPYPKSADFTFRITLTRDGYVAKYLLWANSRHDKFTDIPADYTVKLDPAATIGGVLKNGDGQALSGVRILISGKDDSDADARERTTLAPSFHVETTDDNGRWQFDQAPQQFQDLTFRALHPDYPAANFGCAGSAAGGPAVTRLAPAELLAGKAEMVLSRGLALSGVVVDQEGHPVPGATITRNHEWGDRRNALKSDAQGRFLIRDLQPGDLTLTLQAKGYEAQTRIVTVASGMEEPRIVLFPGRILKGRVLDSAGQPVSGAGVSLDHNGTQPLEYDWHATTDSDGRFLWDSAPAGPHPYLITADSFNLRTEPALEADGQDKIIRLHKQSTNTVIDGIVTDAASGDPVKKFTIILRAAGPGGITNLVQEVNNSDGNYSVEVDRNASAFTLEFRAKNCLPVRTETKFPADGDQRVNMNLVNGSINGFDGLEGVVVLPDGQPVAGADVALCTANLGVELGGRHIKGIYQTNITATAEDGSFVFRPLDGAHAICVASQQGFAQLDITDIASPYRLTLQPWGAIAGTALLAGKPLAGADMALQGPPPNPAAAGLAISPLDYTTATDDSGKFVFSNLPPLDLRLGRMVNGFFDNVEYITVKSGPPTDVKYGGSGAVISARLGVPGYTKPIHWQGGQSIALIADVPEPKQPVFDNEEGEKVWISQFLKSAEGIAWQHAQRSFIANPAEDGSFKIEDVPAGNYKLRIQLREAAEFGGGRLAMLETNLTVAPPSPSNLFANLDLGAVAVPLAVTLRPGDLAPLFETKTIFNHPLKLADYRGKYVLLDFWATWCGPCLAEIPHLKALYEQFGKDPRFAMISLSLDSQTAQPIEFIHEHDIRWVQGFLGEWNASPVPDLYGVDGIPAIFLIGPDGKIIARDLRGEAMSDAVAKALGAD